MKKIICVLFLLGLVLPARAKPFDAALGQPINVVTTTEDLKSITESIGKDKVNVDSIGRGTQNYHFLAAKPSYMMKVKRADLFIRVGLDLEIGYESLILEGSRNRHVQLGRPGHLDVSERIQKLEVPENVDRSMGDVHPGGNPHYWLDPVNAKLIATQIKDRLSQLAPQDEFFFQSNLQKFHAEIDRKMAEWSDQLAPYRTEKVATYHKSWIYFTKRFGLEVACQLEPKPGVPPSPGHLKNVIDIVRKENIKIILNESIYPLKAANFVAEASGAEVVSVPISVGGEEGVADYLTLMDTVVRRVAKGFAHARNR